MNQSVSDSAYQQRLHGLRSVLAALNFVLPNRLVEFAKTRNIVDTRVEFFPNQRVFICIMGQVEGDDADTVAHRILDTATLGLSEAARKESRRAAVAWFGSDSGLAAAFDLTAQDGRQCVATSWRQRHLWQGKVCIAQLDELVLPRAYSDFPHVNLSAIEFDQWPIAVVNLVVRASKAPPRSMPPRPNVQLPLPAEGTIESFGTQLLRLRAQHCRAWWAFDADLAERELVQFALNGATATSFSQIMHVAESLGWDGLVASYNAWPADPVVRDLRLRFAAFRLLFLCRTMHLDGIVEVQQLRQELDFFAWQYPPLIQEPSVCGWADEERRFGVRHYLGGLAKLQELIKRGLGAGLTLNFSQKEETRWMYGLQDRRRDCVDCLLELRRKGFLGWDGKCKMHWDAAYIKVDQFLYTVPEKWERTIPSWVLLGLAGSRLDIAIAMADILWRCSRSHRIDHCKLTTRGEQRFELQLYACPPAEAANSLPTPGCVVLTAQLANQRTLRLELKWNDLSTGPGQALANEPIHV